MYTYVHNYVTGYVCMMHAITTVHLKSGNLNPTPFTTSFWWRGEHCPPRASQNTASLSLSTNPNKPILLLHPVPLVPKNDIGAAPYLSLLRTHIAFRVAASQMPASTWLIPSSTWLVVPSSTAEGLRNFFYFWPTAEERVLNPIFLTLFSI